MLSVFADIVEDWMEVLLDDSSILCDTYETFLDHLGQVLQICEEKNLFLNCKKCHFIVMDGIIFGNKVSQKGLEVDKVKIKVIEKLAQPISVMGVHSLFVNEGFDQRFVKCFSKIAHTL